MKANDDKLKSAFKPHVEEGPAADLDSAPQPRRFKTQMRKAARPDDRPETDLSHIVGLGPMSRVSTSFGEVYAQTLREGDMARTKDGGFLRIQAINRITLGEGFLRYHPGALPIVISAGSLGPNLPVADLTLAPYQKIHMGQRFSGKPIARAIDAIDRPNVNRRMESIITYTVFHCGQPATVISEGMMIDTAP